MPTEEEVITSLKKVLDPELFVNVVDLGLIYGVHIDNEAKTVKVDMTMTSPACPAGPQLVGQSMRVLEDLPDVDKAEVNIVLDPPWSPERMTEDAKDQLGIF